MRSWEGVLEEIVRTDSELDECEVHVGCDSAHNPGGVFVFATVVCIIRKGHAGRYWYARQGTSQSHISPRMVHR